MRPILLALALAVPSAAQVVSTQTFSTQTVVATAPSSFTATSGATGLKLVPADQLPDFTETFKARAGLAKAAKKTLAYLQTYQGPKYFKVADREYSIGELQATLEELMKLLESNPSSEELAKLIPERFDVFQSVGLDGQGRVVFSAYYQPMLVGSRVKTAKYTVPLYQRPPDMVELDLQAFDSKRFAGADPLIGRVDKNKRVLPYFSRGDIDIKKTLSGKGLELAWVQTKFDALDLHIQGSGIIKFTDGKEMLVSYAGTNSLPYNSVGLMLVKAGIFGKDEITRDKLRDYLHGNPDVESWILASNPRYTFFQLKPLPEDGEPFGTIMQSLVPSRSIAIDPAIIPLGALTYFSTTSPQADQEGRLLGVFPNSRFAIGMDTGGAIKSPGRVDIYVGHGKQADTTARHQWADGKLYLLLKKIPPRER